MLLFHHLPVEHKLRMVQLKSETLLFSFYNDRISLLDASIYNGLYSAVRTGGIPSRRKYSRCSCKLYERNFRSLSKSGRSTCKKKSFYSISISILTYIKHFFSSKWSPFSFSMMTRCFSKMCSNMND